MSRTKRWFKAVQTARHALSDLESAFDDLNEIKEEYQEWRDNLPESLESSPVAEKLDTVIDLEFDLEGDISGTLDEAENADLFFLSVSGVRGDPLLLFRFT